MSMKRQIIFLGLFILLGVFSLKVTAQENNNQKNLNSIEKGNLEKDGNWILGFSDDQIEVSYLLMNCEGKEMYKMRIINKGLNAIQLKYSFWKDAAPKEMRIEPLANLEGICSEAYNYPLMEIISKEQRGKKTNLLINYNIL